MAANTIGMKKTIALLASAVIVLPVAGATAAKPKRQTVKGTIAAPQPYTDSTCFYRAQRGLFGAAGDQANGAIGYTFEIDPKTVNKPFKLTASEGAGLDISFYSELGDATDPTTAPTNYPYETPGTGGEKGKVPPGFKYAFVCMTEGSQASFTYTAGKGVK